MEQGDRAPIIKEERLTMPRIYVIGALVSDMIFEVPDWVTPNRAVHASRVTRSPGGKALNQAAAACRLGADVTLVGCVGDDALGDELRSAAAQAGINVDHVIKHKSAATSVAAIIVQDNVPGFIGAPDASRKITAADIRTALADISADDVLLVNFEIPQPLVQLALQLGRAAAAATVLNPAPFFTRDSFALKGLHLVDVIIPNKLEAQLLTDCPADDPDELARRLFDLGIGQAVLTLGEAGSILFEGSSRIEQPAFALEVVDTTGASDAFVGAYGCGLVNGWPAEKTLAFASAAAALACTKHGTMSSMPTRPAVNRLLASSPPTSTRMKTSP